MRRARPTASKDPMSNKDDDPCKGEELRAKAKERKGKRPNLEELEEILNADEDVAIEILPNGEVRMLSDGKKVKPLTMRDDLGGEYAA